MQDVLPRNLAPYCGAPPTPTEIAGHWNFDPPLIFGFLIVLIAYLLRPEQDARWRDWCFLGGWAVGALALVSPLCSLSVALFSARVGEHMILATISAPLVALGRPFVRLFGLRPHPVSAAAAFVAVLWFWHAPAPYDATFAGEPAFWAMQGTLYGTALWFWTALFERAGDHPAGSVLAIFLTTGAMGLLGAIITFAARPLYLPHVATTLAWGMTPLQDQQLGGVIMWIPAGAIFAAALAGCFVHVMRHPETRTVRAA